VHDETIGGVARNMTMGRQRDVQGGVGGIVTRLEHPVMSKGADARERSACRPSCPGVGRQIARREPTHPDAIKGAVAQTKPEISFAVPSIKQLTTRGDASKPPNRPVER
jgi:hypothetical protein